MLSLGEIADLIGAECHGDCSITVNSVADIQKAGPGQLSFVTNASYAKYLQSSKASGIITSPEISSEAALSTKHVNLLLMKDPYLGYGTLQPNSGRNSFSTPPAYFNQHNNYIDNNKVGNRIGFYNILFSRGYRTY